ncbi:allophanate hydrolase [Microlunatus ginsengisoli]|uniref:Amidase domain-containing protein n=1 Tax=Microlunatus ginsengisoli TaxID=363863 RepID=A0ABP7AS12_9ACTN
MAFSSLIATSAGPTLGPTIARLREAYRSGATSPDVVCARILSTIDTRGEDGVWISLATLPDVLARCAELAATPGAASLPLYGVPFGVKDSIDVEGWQTTLACPDYAYLATETAPVITALLDAGAIMIGKTNLDQFATGLNGTRTPYPVPHSVYGDDLISGGSSSGSALAVALGDVPIAVATDTAGSGRVPPALNGVIGFKPSRGLISTVGLVPACRSLDCISLIAGTVDDLETVFDLVAARDRRDPWNRERSRRSVDPASVVVGLPPMGDLEFFGDDAMAAGHARARAVWSERFDVRPVPLQPFLDAGELLYSGPWVAERYLEFGDFLAEHPDGVLPVIAKIIGSGAGYSAVDVFRAQYRLTELKAVVTEIFATVDVIVLPTIGTTFTVDEVLADPIATNTVLGHYTHFGNLLDLCAVAVPAGRAADGRPVSCMVLGPALADDVVLKVAATFAGMTDRL